MASKAIMVVVQIRLLYPMINDPVPVVTYLLCPVY